jgi:hypothetical protein
MCFIGSVFAVIIAFFAILIFSEEIFCGIKHHGFNPPPGYSILTNGKDYKWRKDGNNINSPSVFTFRSTAVSRAWWDYERYKKIENKSNAHWEVTK